MVVTLLLLKRVFMGNTLLLPPCRSNADDIAKSIQELGVIAAVAQALRDQMQDKDASLQVCAASGPRLACARRCNKNPQTEQCILGCMLFCAQHLVQPVLVLPSRSMGRASCNGQMSCRSTTECSRPWLRRGRSVCRQLRSQAAVCSSHLAQAPPLLASECHGSPALQLPEGESS